MASARLARVIELNEKAHGLSDKGHHARAAEIYGRAVEAAQMLGYEDCLIVVKLQVAQCFALCLHNAAACQSLSRDSKMEHYVQADQLAHACLPTAMATLLRRMAAGTLLPDTCRPGEVALMNSALRFLSSLRATSADDDAMARSAKCAGYDTLVTTAQSVFAYLLNPDHIHDSMNADHVLAARAFVAAALDVMPRIPVTYPALAAELSLLNSFQLLAKYVRPGSPLHDFYKPLFDARDRVLRNSVARRRGLIEARSAQVLQDVAESHHKTTVAAAAEGVRSCALAGCGAREVHVQQFKSCAACRTVVYCCREHQVEGWPAHKKACKAARKAAATEGGAGWSS